ncbi:MAG: DNA polymerase III subunit delta' [Pseudomonadota bacterium]
MYPWLETTFSELMQRYASNALHHALLFRSTQSSDSEGFLSDIAKSMLCQDKSSLTYCGKCKSCKLFDSQAHPDFHLAVSEKASIGVDLIRHIIEKIQKTSQLNGSKVIVVNQIDTMTDAASNAFLKTLEEPTPDTFILLSTTQPDRLMATIKSRCEQIALPSPSFEQSCDYLSTLGITPPTKQALIVVGNSPLRYVESLESGKSSYAKFQDDFVSYVNGQIEYNDFIDDFDGRETEVFDWVYHFIINQDPFELSNPNVTNEPRSPNKSVTDTQLIAQYEWIQNTLVPAKKKLLHQGINKTLLLKNTLEDYKQCQHMLVAQSKQ